MSQWHFPDGPAATQLALRSGWETFQRAGAIAEGVRPEIARSWQRSAQANLQPALRGAPLDTAALRGFDDAGPGRRRFFRAAGFVADGVAAELDDAAAAAVVVCDGAGLLLHRSGSAPVLDLVEKFNLIPGGMWSEPSAGTNAVGLALATGGPGHVYAAEHFAEVLHCFSCTAAPVRHPVTREILGVLSLATGANVSAFYSMPLMLAAARDVEHRLQEQVAGRERELMEHYLRSRAGHTIPFLTVDRAGHTVIQNAQMLKTASGDEVARVLEIAREALASELDVAGELQLPTGRFLAEGHVIRDGGEIQGALVSLRPLIGPARERTVAPVPTIVAESEPMRLVLAAADGAARGRTPTIIWGPAGTGKLTLAEHMHRIAGGGPITVVGCAAEHWGAQLTRAAAVGGTAVLRHVHELDRPSQLILCDRIDALTEAGSRTWLIALADPQGPRLDRELLSRLAEASLTLPPLGDRPDDLQPLVEHWCSAHEARFGTRPALSAGALGMISAHTWPGNVRELMSVLDAAGRRGGPVIGGKSLRLVPPAPTIPATLRDIERAAIEAALERTNGNVTQAARDLGIGRATLHRRLRDYRLLDARVPAGG